MVSEDADGILAEAYSILEKIDHDVFIKIPITEQGLKAIQILKKDDAMVTATAIYTEAQALLATAAGADYLAVYYNRMENMDIDPCHVISATAKLIERNQLKTYLLGASFKNMGQVQKAFEAGANAVTVQPSLLYDALKMPAIQKAVDDFRADWAALYGNVSIAAL
jgi:TalC/MipB family fructose-6-phosphate aldolase